MIFNREKNLPKKQGSVQHEFPGLLQSTDSVRLKIKQNQKNNIFPSCDTSESLSFMGRNAQNEGKSQKKSIIEGIINFDQSLRFQHSQQLYGSKVNALRQQNGQDIMDNWDFSFNDQFASNIYQQNLLCSEKEKINSSFLLPRVNFIKNNTIILSQELIQIKKQMVRFHQQKKFIVDEIKAKISKRVALCFTQISAENRILKNLLQNGLEDQKKSKQNQNFLSEKCLKMGQRISLLSQNILQNQEEIKQLKLKNQALIGYNQQLLKNQKILSSHESFVKGNRTFFCLKQGQIKGLCDFRKNMADYPPNQEQALNNFSNILCNLIDCSDLSHEVKFTFEQISMKISNQLSKDAKYFQTHQQTYRKPQKYKKNYICLKQMPLKIKYSLLIIFSLQASTDSNGLTNNISHTQNLYDSFTTQALLNELKSMWLQRQHIEKNISLDEVQENSNFIHSSSIASIKIQKFPTDSKDNIHEFELGGDSLSLGKSRSQISLMHDRLQQIKKKIAGK